MENIKLSRSLYQLEKNALNPLKAIKGLFKNKTVANRANDLVQGVKPIKFINETPLSELNHITNKPSIIQRFKNRFKKDPTKTVSSRAEIKTPASTNNFKNFLKDNKKGLMYGGLAGAGIGAAGLGLYHLQQKTQQNNQPYYQ